MPVIFVILVQLKRAKKELSVLYVFTFQTTNKYNYKLSMYCSKIKSYFLYCQKSIKNKFRLGSYIEDNLYILKKKATHYSFKKFGLDAQSPVQPRYN